MEKIKIILPFRSCPTRNRKFQKNRKKLKKLKNTITNSFQAKIGWKIIVPFRSYPTRNRKFEKNSKKNKKIKKYHYGFISSQNGLEKYEKERK